MKRLVADILIVSCLASCLAPCASRGSEDGGPADHVVIFGSLHVDSLLQEQTIERILLVQVDAAFPPVRQEAFLRGCMFFTDPLPAGGCWRISSVGLAQEELEVIYPDGPGQPSVLEFRPPGPGLFFAGSLEISGDPPQARQARVRELPDLRQHLQVLRDAYRGTPWETRIWAAIRSLRREKKS